MNLWPMDVVKVQKLAGPVQAGPKTVGAGLDSTLSYLPLLGGLPYLCLWRLVHRSQPTHVGHQSLGGRLGAGACALPSSPPPTLLVCYFPASCTQLSGLSRFGRPPAPVLYSDYCALTSLY